MRELVLHLKETGAKVEILTTCVEKFASDWNFNYYHEGNVVEHGITIRRFLVRKRNTEAFDRINYKLINSNVPITLEEEEIFLRENINSPQLYQYMEEHSNEYDYYVFIPYLFGTTYYGVQVAPEKSILIPCFHDESYFYLKHFQTVFSSVAAIVYNAEPERRLAEKNYNLENVCQVVMGIGMETEVFGVPNRFRTKYGINEEFVLYAGRKDAGKNVDVLLAYFAEYKRRNKNSIKLVMIGGGEIDIPESIRRDVCDLGFVPIQDKYDACSAAIALCQPSSHESFSFVIMESWLCGKPVLVSGQCEVTKDFAIQSNGGLYFDDYFEFEGAVNYLMDNKHIADDMGRNGRVFVKDNFAWDVIVEKYLGFFEGLDSQKQI